MSDDAGLRVVLCWHMHQPQYCDLISGEYRQPWTYLHATKDYVDMAAHLEAVPDARAVVNFAPVLLEQIDDYAAQVRGYLHEHKPLRDPLMAALVEPVLPAHPERRLELINSCLRLNRQRVIDRFAPFRRLVQLVEPFRDNCNDLIYVSDQLLADLLFWYHLGWIGETVRRNDLRIQRWQEQGSNFSLHERRELLALIGELLAGVIERYARLADAGRVELALSPYGHPIIPLMLEMHSAREAMPEVQLPELEFYQGGEERARWQLREGLRIFEQYFGRRPLGCWPAEGSVSTATLELLGEHGLRWAASGETVLRNSLAASLGADASAAPDALFKGYRVSERAPVCFFRDDNLSDEIGFTYSGWHADDAVANFLHHLENIARGQRRRKLAVAIVLDGENAWEHYPDNGYYFLRALYQRLAAHPRIRLSTFAACLEEGIEIAPLAKMVSGSWVYGTFSTWVGDRDKNRGWDMLGDAKRAFDQVMAARSLDSEQVAAAELQLAVCEGSDWFWWFGDYNPADSVSDFESLYRMHLANLYRLLGLEPPEYLAHTFARGSGRPEMGGVMRHGQARD